MKEGRGSQHKNGCFYDFTENSILYQHFSRHSFFCSFVYVFELDIKFDECYHPNIKYLDEKIKPSPVPQAIAVMMVVILTLKIMIHVLPLCR